MEFLKGSIFDKPFMQSKVKTARMTAKEKFLGHILGPAGALCLYACITGLRELYYTRIIVIDNLFGTGTYMAMTVVTTIIGILTGIGVNFLTEKTVCKAGRFRPYLLIGEILLAISGTLLFFNPFANGSAAQLVWLYAFNIIYTCFALTLYNLKDNVISVITRNVLERNSVTTLRSGIGNMISGVVIALGINGALYDAVLKNDYTGKSWIITVGALGVVTLILAFVEYFWTKERITEDNKEINDNSEEAVKVPLKEQFKNLFHNKYYILAVIMYVFALLSANMQGGNVRVNMSEVILDQPVTLYLIVAMQPIAIGAVVVPILARKHGSRKIMFISAIISLCGIGIALINPSSFAIAVAGGLIFAAGTYAVSNLYPTFMQQANDITEYRHGYRAEGTLALGIISTLYTALLSPVNALYETVLIKLGYVAENGANQPDSVKTWILIAFYGSYAIICLAVLIISIFFDAEKKMPEIHKALRDRAVAAAEARGETYISPEEKEAMEIKAAAEELEASRIEELKAKCEKKGLDFETENKKYLDKLAAKQAKIEAKSKKK